MSLRFYYLSSKYETRLFMVTDFTTKLAENCWTTLRSFPEPDFERMIDKRSYPRERYSNQTALAHLTIAKLIFITYFNLIGVINYRK